MQAKKGLNQEKKEKHKKGVRKASPPTGTLLRKRKRRNRTPENQPEVRGGSRGRGKKSTKSTAFGILPC